MINVKFEKSRNEIEFFDNFTNQITFFKDFIVKNSVIYYKLVNTQRNIYIYI